MSIQSTSKAPAEAAPVRVVTYRGRQLEGMAAAELRDVIDDMVTQYQGRLRMLREELEGLRAMSKNPTFEDGVEFATKEYRNIILEKIQAIGLDIGLDADAGGN